MPTAHSVVVVAAPHSLGAFYPPDIRMWTRNKKQTSRLLDQTAEMISRFLKREGFLSLPVSADKAAESHKLDPATGKRPPHARTVGHRSLKRAAVTAGMGQTGRSNLLLTPDFGPHQRLGGMITEARLEPDPPHRWELCIPGCTACEDACPVGTPRGNRYDENPCFGAVAKLFLFTMNMIR